MNVESNVECEPFTESVNNITDIIPKEVFSLLSETTKKWNESKSDEEVDFAVLTRELVSTSIEHARDQETVANLANDENPCYLSVHVWIVKDIVEAYEWSENNGSQREYQ